MELFPFTLIAFLGLAVGSFLNVVVYRFPIMLNREWRSECIDFLGLEKEFSEETTSLNLFLPNSHCPNCKAGIKPHHNIPVFSYLLLRGKCANCRDAISWRYPVIELLTMGFSLVVAWHFGWTFQLLPALIFTWTLIALTLIDIDHQLLPDNITLPLLWLGLLLNLKAVYVPIDAAIIGAATGYLTLWGFMQLYKLFTGKEGMGHGDFKLMAVFGGWLGWQVLPFILIAASALGAVVGISLILFRQHDKDIPIPFGPYLALAGWIALLFGEQINVFYWQIIGI